MILVVVIALIFVAMFAVPIAMVVPMVLGEGKTRAEQENREGKRAHPFIRLHLSLPSEANKFQDSQKLFVTRCVNNECVSCFRSGR